MLSLYLHTPFCKQKCAYCAFYSAPAGEDEKARYAAALCTAITEAGRAECRPLSTLYLGGGTPALLGAERLIQVIGSVRKAFTLQTDAEITVELNPESTTPPLLDALKQAGVNRISLGVQSLCDGELKTLGRLHDREGALTALQRIFDTGFKNVSVDVMFGLPGQTKETFTSTLNTLLSYPITHLSSYSLQLEEGTPMGDSASPMDEEQEELLWQILCRKAREAGMEHYEISNFAKPGFASRHNLAYWRRTDYIGLGAAAHSFWNGVRYSFPEDREAFCRAPWPLQNPQPVEKNEAWEEQIMLGLRTLEGIPLSILPQGFDPAKYQAFSTVRDGSFILNEKGFYLSNAIISEILTKE
ncbi:MAG: radical SAM family heme chaperone HemW [Clostridia bacterium]|nr:radical SAM family heme chaperone HemW [Clostridia bacterium]